MLLYFYYFSLSTQPVEYASKSTHKKVESPDIIQRGGYYLAIIPAVLFGLMSLLGLLISNTHMFITCALMTLMFVGLAYFVRRKFKNLYTETEDYFFLNGQHLSFQVEYDDIIDWMPFSKQIGVRDGTIENSPYICVNLKFSEPEILLRKLAEMTFAGDFKDTVGSTAEDPNREQELTDFFHKNGYSHIVEEVMQEVSLNE